MFAYPYFLKEWKTCMITNAILRTPFCLEDNSGIVNVINCQGSY